MKLLLPVGVLLVAAGACCCGGDLEKVLEEAGVNTGSAATDGRIMFSVPGNERVRIVDLSTEDAYYSDKATIVGTTCTTDGPSTYNGDGWHGGSVKDCSNGSTYYFYKAAYVDMGPAAAVATTSVPAIPGLRATRPLPSGSRVKILDLHSEDAYYPDRSTIMGKACRLDGESSLKDVEWHGGQVYCDDGSSYYFYKAAYEDLGGGTAPTAPPGALTYSVPSGSRVTILDVASDDAYYSDRATIIGKVCTLGEASSLKDGYWHGGSIACDDGSSYYFYKASYALSGSAPVVSRPPGALDYSLPTGTRIIIADIATDDAYFSSKSSMIGKRCTMGEQSTLRDGYWHGGQVNCDDGSGYYFYKAAFQSGG